MGRLIGAALGGVIDVDTNANDVGCGPFLRIKVRLPMKKPLLRGKIVKFPHRDYTVKFRYENLPHICFNCGRIVHEEGVCPIVNTNRIHKTKAGD